MNKIVERYPIVNYNKNSSIEGFVRKVISGEPPTNLVTKHVGFRTIVAVAAIREPRGSAMRSPDWFFASTFVTGGAERKGANGARGTN